MSIGACLNLPVGFVMDRQYQPTAGYKSEESNSILWDLDSSSMILPPNFFIPNTSSELNRPLHHANNMPLSFIDTIHREISEESGYQTAIDDGSSSWASDYWLTGDEQPIEYHQRWSSCPSSDGLPAQQVNNNDDDQMAYWLQQPTTSNSWGIPDAFTVDPPEPPDLTSTNNQPTEQHSTPAGRSESTSSDDSTLNDVYVPSGKYD